MKASVPTPDNGAGRSTANGRIFGLKKSTLSLITALAVGTPLLVACDSADAIPVNTEVTSTPAATTTEQTPAPTTTSKAPKPEPTSSTETTSAETTVPSETSVPEPSVTESPEPIEPEIDLTPLQKRLDAYIANSTGGVSKIELILALDSDDEFTVDDAKSVIDSNDFDWNEQAVHEANWLLDNEEPVSRTSLRKAFEENELASTFTPDEISQAIEQIDWQPFANQEVSRIDAELNTINADYLHEAVSYHLDGFTDEELRTAIRLIDWDSKEQILVGDFLAEGPGGKSRKATTDWLVSMGFSESEADEILTKQNVNWNEQALLEAKYQVQLMSWVNPPELQDQMHSRYNGFTEDEIQFGIDNAVDNWVEHAATGIESYLENSYGFSKSEIAEELRNWGFSDLDINQAFEELDVDWNKHTLRHAERLLESSQGISRAELHDRLNDRFTGLDERENVQYAMDNIDVDWNQQAVNRGYALVNSRYTTYSYYGVYEELVRSPISFTHEQAEYAIQNLEVDWVSRASTRLDSYLSIFDFSKEEARRQLLYTGFTPEQTTQALDEKPAKVWQENALRSARTHLRTNDLTRSELIHRLANWDEFTQDEAEFAADKVGL